MTIPPLAVAVSVELPVNEEAPLKARPDVECGQRKDKIVRITTRQAVAERTASPPVLLASVMLIAELKALMPAVETVRVLELLPVTFESLVPLHVLEANDKLVRRAGADDGEVFVGEQPEIQRRAGSLNVAKSQRSSRLSMPRWRKRQELAGCGRLWRGFCFGNFLRLP